MKEGYERKAPCSRRFGRLPSLNEVLCNYMTLQGGSLKLHFWTNRVERPYTIINKLRVGNSSTELAEEMLLVFESIQIQYKAHLDRILKSNLTWACQLSN